MVLSFKALLCAVPAYVRRSTSSSGFFTFIREKWANGKLHGHLYMSRETQMRCKEQGIVWTPSKALSALGTVGPYFAAGVAETWLCYR